MGKNKPTANPFYFFFMELKQKQKHAISNERAVELASPLWAKMSSEQRRPYEEKARIAKKNRVKETCAGESVYLLLQQQKVTIQKELKAKRETENMVKLANSDGTLTDTYFYLLHMNYFLFHEVDNKYYPAEVAVGKFNLKNGILKEEVYHSNVYPGKFPIGYKLTAQQKGEETHKLSIEFGNKDNIKEVLETIFDFNRDQAPFFVLEKELFIVEKMLQDLCAEYGVDNTFNIYPLDYLFYVLKNMVHGPENKVWPVTSLGTISLEKDPYEMCEEIACDYHQVVERQAFCSKSKVLRWAYMVCDNCCHLMGIHLVPGRHVPTNALVDNTKLAKLASGLSKMSLSKDSDDIRDGKSATIPKSVKEVTTLPTEPVSTNVSSVGYDSDIDSYHGFASSDSQAAEEDEEPWIVPKRSVRLRSHHASAAEENLTAASASQSQRSQSQSQLFDMSDLTIKSNYLPGRRPGDMSEVGYRGRGRGRFNKRNE